MPRLDFDHLVIGAASLRQGVDWVADRLGVAMPPGGSHPRMGTHNHLTALGPDSFLEVIAVDPAAEPPARPRWFALDDPARRTSLEARPRLLTWVAATGDIEASLALASAAGAELGRAVEMTRGELTWLISIRDDGGLPEMGTLPALIQWPHHAHPGGAHPASRMTDLGLRLDTLELRHPDPAKLGAVLKAIGADHLVEVVQDDRPVPSLRAALHSSEVPLEGKPSLHGRAEIS
jgi:hypothetical protein